MKESVIHAALGREMLDLRAELLDELPVEEEVEE